MTIDFQGLMDVIKASEGKPLDMTNWICGTYGCLIGNYCLSEYNTQGLRIQGSQPWLHNINSYEAIACRFGITVLEAEWLFGYGVCVGKAVLFSREMRRQPEVYLNRLRKFIYYKLHKQEMTLEEGRHISGNLAAPRALEGIQ